MINVALLRHWQNWIIVGFVFVLVMGVILSVNKAKVKEG
jgi:hypothetical protein